MIVLHHIFVSNYRWILKDFKLKNSNEQKFLNFTGTGQIFLTNFLVTALIFHSKPIKNKLNSTNNSFNIYERTKNEVDDDYSGVFLSPLNNVKIF